MQAVLQDTKPDDVFSVSCLRAKCDKLGKAVQKLLDEGLLVKAQKPEKIRRDNTMYSTFQGFFRKVPVAQHGEETGKLRTHLDVNAKHFAASAEIVPDPAV